MAAERRTPFSMAICRAIILIAAQLAPSDRRTEWKREWLAEIWYRRHFLRLLGEWRPGQALRLMRDCLGAFVDAGSQLAHEERLRSRVRQWARSPWLCIGLLGALLSAVGIVSGFAAMRQLLFGAAQEPPNLISVWLHRAGGGGDRGLPAELAPAWSKSSRLLEGAAAFTARDASISARGVAGRLLMVKTEPNLFTVFDTRPALGSIPRTKAVVLDHRTWVSMFHSDAGIIGSTVALNGVSYHVSGVLPPSFHFLSRRASLFLVAPQRGDAETMIVARARPGVTATQLNRELTTIAEDCCYYFYSSELRLRFLGSTVLTPLRFFGMAVGIGAAMLLAVARVRWRVWRAGWARAQRQAMFRRLAFFSAKTGLALATVFAAGLEWSRPDSAILFGTRDPASGPFLIWLYILGAMGVLFWSFADQRARCRVCLRLLGFPVRIGCPGCLLLDWSGTELLCSEGHGVLHVPHLAPSWEEEREHWITLDESWQALFAHSREE